MSELFSAVTDKLYHLKGADVDEVIRAEKTLGMRFDEEYRNYLLTYGVVSFGSHELLGIGGDSYLDVVHETLRERENPDFPKDCYLIENVGIDGRLIIQNEDGGVFQLSDAGVRKIADSLREYIDMIG